MEILQQFKEYVERRAGRGRRNAHTIRSYCTQARLFVEWCEERGVDPRTASEDDVVDYRADLVARYSPATVALKLQAVRTLFEALGVEPNPAEQVYAPRDDRPPSEDKYLSARQVLRVLEQVATVANPVQRARDEAMIRVLVTLGLRAQELCDLRLGDVFDDGRLRVRGKGNRTRTVYVPEDTGAALGGWMAVRPTTTSDRVFVGLTGRGGLTTGGLRHVVNGHLRAAGVKVSGQAVHVMRHTALTFAIAGGANRVDVQRMAGHIDPRMTDRYVHLLEAEQHNPARFVEEMLRDQM